MSREEAIERCNQLIKLEHANWIGINNQEAIETVLNLIQEQEEEIEKKDKIIDEMAPRIFLNKEEREEMKKDIYNNVNHKGFADFVKRYFEKKVTDTNVGD